MRHPFQSDLALYATGDLPLWRRPMIRLHVSGCDSCRSWVEAFSADRESLRGLAAEMPAGVNWDRLAAEMSANVRVGLEAGLDILTDRERMALLLRDVEDLPAEEVAARLQCSKATVRSHIANARVKLRKHFARLQKRGQA